MDLRPKPGHGIGGEIIDLLRAEASKRRATDSHRTLVPDAPSAALKDVTNVVNDFKPAKLISKKYTGAAHLFIIPLLFLVDTEAIYYFLFKLALNTTGFRERRTRPSVIFHDGLNSYF